MTWSIKVQIRPTSNTSSFCSQLAHTPAYRVCWGIQLLVPPLGNLLRLKSLTFRTSFIFLCISLSTGAVHLLRRGSHNQNNTMWPAKANQIDAKKMHVSAASLAPDWSVHKVTPSDNTERTARSGAVVETIFLSRPRHVQCSLQQGPHDIAFLQLLCSHKTSTAVSACAGANCKRLCHSTSGLILN